MSKERNFVLSVDARYIALIAAVTAVVVVVSAARLYDIASASSSFLAFCADAGQLVADWMTGSTPGRLTALAAMTLLAVSVVRAAWFAIQSSVRCAALRRDLRQRAVPAPGKAVRAAAEVGMSIPTVVVDRETYAFTTGLLAPVVVVSSGLVSRLSLAELRAVLQHERQHQSRRDPLRAFAAELTRTTFFWLPTLRDFADHCALSREIAADRAAAKTNIERRALASALLKVASRTGTLPQGAVAFGQFVHRVDALTLPSYRTPFRIAPWRFAATLAVLSVIAVGGGVGAPASASEGDRLCVEASSERAVTAGFTPFVLIMTSASPMSEAGGYSPLVP